MSILGPVTDVNRSAWQRQAVKVLAEILQAGCRRELPTLHWSLGRTGALIGTCLATDMQERRAAFIAWVDFLGIDDWRAWDSDGATHMTGTAGQAFHGNSGAPRCKVTITAAVDSAALIRAGA